MKIKIISGSINRDEDLDKLQERANAFIAYARTIASGPVEVQTCTACWNAVIWMTITIIY